MQQWFHFVSLSNGQVRWILWLLAVEVLIKLADGVHHAGFRSHGDYALHVGFYFTIMLLQMLAVGALALSGYGPLAAAAAFAGIRALATPCSAVWLLRRHRDLHLGPQHARRAELQRLARPALANLSMPGHGTQHPRHGAGGRRHPGRPGWHRLGRAPWFRARGRLNAAGNSPSMHPSAAVPDRHRRRGAWYVPVRWPASPRPRRSVRTRASRADGCCRLSTD